MHGEPNFHRSAHTHTYEVQSYVWPDSLFEIHMQLQKGAAITIFCLSFILYQKSIFLSFCLCSIIIKIVKIDNCASIDIQGCLTPSLDITESPTPSSNLRFTFENDPLFLKKITLNIKDNLYYLC